MATPSLPHWQELILRGVGAPATPENIKFMNAWAQAEGGSAENNPFNTTQGGAGVIGNYNSVGVKRYANPQAGIAATIATLKNGHYAPILAALHKGSSAIADAQAESQTPWGTGSLILKVLGGKVTGGQPTQPGGAAGLATALQTGAIPPQQGPDPMNLLSQIFQSNAALMQRPRSGYKAF